jgi:microcompartment protein CcmK/EutM
MYGVTCRGHRYYCDSFGAAMQRSVLVVLKAAARKSGNEWTFVCDGTVLGRADLGYVSPRRGGVASRDPL